MRIVGFWVHKKSEIVPDKLIAWGYPEPEDGYWTIMNTFHDAFPKVNISNVVLTFDQTLERYQKVWAEQEARGCK